MRTFLTYVLAIALLTILATAPILVISAVVYSEGTGHGGEWPSLSAWWLSISTTAPFAGLVAVALAVIAVPAWFVWQRGFVTLHRKLGQRFNLIGGLVVGLTLGMIALMVRAVIWFRDFAVNPLGEASFYIVAAAISGLAWGTVFWLRQPKSEPVGLAA